MKASKPPSVLVIEDDPINLEGMQAHLAREGFTVYTATTHSESLQQFKIGKPDIVILDIILVQYVAAEVRTLSGLELAQMLRQHNPKTGFIFRTAYTHFSQNVLKFIEEGNGSGAYLFRGGGHLLELTHALHTVLSGGVYFDPHILSIGSSALDIMLRLVPIEERNLIEALLPRFATLTPREIEILETLCWSRTKVAERLNISVRTVDRHINTLYKKLDLPLEQFSHIRQDVLLAKAYMIYQVESHHILPGRPKRGNRVRMDLNPI